MKPESTPSLPDSDSPEWTDAMFASAATGEAALAGIFGSEAAQSLTQGTATVRRLGRPPSTTKKVQVSLRVDPDILAAYAATGPGWQTRMNLALRSGMPSSTAPAKDHRA